MESSRKKKILVITVDAAVSVNHSTQNKNTKKLLVEEVATTKVAIWNIGFPAVDETK